MIQYIEQKRIVLNSEDFSENEGDDTGMKTIKLHAVRSPHGVFIIQ